MRRVTALLSMAAFVFMTVGAFAQAKPSFAGKWVREAPAAPPAGTPPAGGGRGGGGGGGWGQNPTITQDATTLTIEYMTGPPDNQTPAKLVYKLDGTESKNTGRGGAEVVSKVTWDGAKLVITTPTQNGERKQVVSLEAGNLVIETTSPAREGGTPTTSKVVYKKA